MDHSTHAEHPAMNLECDGSVNMYKMGSWKGHVLPGIVFIIWGAWWTYSIGARLLWRRNPATFRSQAWYSFPSRAMSLIEPIIKIILPPVAVSIELYFDHSDGYRYMICPPGTKFEGRFALTHMNNWQHTVIYPSFVLSGIIDLVSTRVTLPRGTTHAFLATAFANMAFIMGTHEKHEAQDRMVHWLLFVSMMLCTLFILLEMHTPRNPLPALGRAASTILQGAWLVQIAKIEFEDRLLWEEKYGAGAMIAPVYFVAFGVIVVASLTALLAVMAVLRSSNLVPSRLLDSNEYGEIIYTRLASTAAAEDSDGFNPKYDPEQKGLLQMVGRNTTGGSFGGDSAHHSDDGSPRRNGGTIAFNMA